MLPCIACKKRDEEEEDEEDDEERIAAKEHVRSLTSQLKDIVLKVSAAYRQCRPCANIRGGDSAMVEPELTDASSSDEFYSKIRKGYASNGSDANKISASSSNSNGTKTEEDTNEWVAQVEPGVLITFVAMPNGENELKRIRFSRDLFNRWQAEAWWAENCERVHELYNVSGNDHSFPNTRKEDEEQTRLPENQHQEAKQHVATGNSSDELTEWVEEDEPGVYITVRIGSSGNRELKRVRFSREKFSEKQAKLWWERNRFRIHDNYL